MYVHASMYAGCIWTYTNAYGNCPHMQGLILGDLADCAMFGAKIPGPSFFSNYHEKRSQSSLPYESQQRARDYKKTMMFPPCTLNTKV